MQWQRIADEGGWDDAFEKELLSVWRAERMEHTLRARMQDFLVKIESTVVNQVVSQMSPFTQEEISTDIVKTLAWGELAKWLTFVQQRSLVKRMAEAGIGASWNPVIVAVLIGEFFQFANEGGRTYLQQIIRRVEMVHRLAMAEAGCSA